jgi:lysine biosynthesis protein LysW
MAEQTQKLITTRCPRCHARLSFSRAPESESWQCCPECGASLRVVSTTPLELRWEEQRYCDDEDRWP